MFSQGILKFQEKISREFFRLPWFCANLEDSILFYLLYLSSRISDLPFARNSTIFQKLTAGRFFVLFDKSTDFLELLNVPEIWIK